jgi:signal transduction histidine kinase
MCVMSEIDPTEGQAGKGETLARWRADLEQWPSPALLADESMTVTAANRLGVDQGVRVGSNAPQWMAALSEKVQTSRSHSLPDVNLRFFPVHADDFSGWFVESVKEPGSGSARNTTGVPARPRVDTTLRLQEEIRRRRFLERQVLSVAEAENRRISMELHDDLGQHLTGVAFLARTCADALKASGSPQAENVAELTRLINEGIGKTRALSRGLWPVSLERGSLKQAVQMLAQDLSSIYGISCTVQADTEIQLASRTAAHYLFRIIQEAATNAIKHGKASRLDFRLERSGRDFVVAIRNDGMPLPANAIARTNGIGIAAMKLRAEALGCDLTIQAQESGGTEVLVTLRRTPQ